MLTRPGPSSLTRSSRAAPRTIEAGKSGSRGGARGDDRSPPTGKPTRTPAFVAFSVGGAAAIGAVVTGLVAKSKFNDGKERRDPSVRRRRCNDRCRK